MSCLDKRVCIQSLHRCSKTALNSVKSHDCIHLRKQLLGWPLSNCILSPSIMSNRVDWIHWYLQVPHIQTSSAPESLATCIHIQGTAHRSVFYSAPLGYLPTNKNIAYEVSKTFCRQLQTDTRIAYKQQMITELVPDQDLFLYYRAHSFTFKGKQQFPFTR